TFNQVKAAQVEPEQVVETKVDDPGDKADLSNPDPGINPEVPLNYDVPRLEDVSVPGPVDPSQSIGIPGAPPDAPQDNIPAPPGLGNGLGGGITSDTAGHAALNDLFGGKGGLMVAGGFGGRSGSTRERLAMEGGGNALSEAAVANGLLFLARHQSADGHWSMEHWDRNYHAKESDPSAPRAPYNGTGLGTNNDVAGTAFGLLPFLGAGYTHKPPAADATGKAPHINYQKVVKAGLDYLIRKQTAQGEFPGGMYAHGLAAIAVCEAYGLTSDPLLKRSAQKAIDFIVYAQDPSKGGWRYTPRTDSDTSVTGWQVMALKSGQMAGLNVPSGTLRGAEKWLDSCMTKDKGGYGYTGPEETPTMTSVGLLCRMYLGWSPKNPGLLAGVKKLKAYPPGSINSLYYYYYATQVMHHMGGEDFAAWNPKMRDLLIKTQDKGTDAKRPMQRGSWDPKGDVHGTVGGRIMITSLSLLTLEVYYRHLPLYKRDLGVMKE
ncbi:MAG TPA: prenyltransferase/squalene oxidase repeat-containing protein, partial [Gemmataceae bacterium]|nr:prenyltransferase/squalene oxidase repeat-containing protein [Gemmataceae bacterium]